MNTRLSIRIKLIVAALALSTVWAFCTFDRMGERAAGEVTFRIVCAALGVALAFFGVFRRPQLHLLWGWCLAAAAPVLVVLSIIQFHGAELACGSVAALAASIGAYLLLADESVRAYRASIKRQAVT